MPRVSVIVPAYNVERYIEQSIRSVLAQTFKDFELIVVDDGSSDTTVARARSFKDSRVRIVSQANRGLAGARNGGIRAARGEYLAFLDADDLWHPDKLARHVEHLDSRLIVGVSYSQTAFIDDAGAPLHYLQRPKLDKVRPQDVFLRNPVGNGSAPVIRATTLRDIGHAAPNGANELWYFDENFRRTEDVECWMRIALTTRWRFEGIGMPLTLYRVNSGGLSANLESQFASWQDMLHKVSHYAPAFAARHGAAARGYQLRYLARRAIRNGEPLVALRLLSGALRSHPGMWLEEPARSAATLLAALFCLALPAKIYQGLETLGMRAAELCSARRAAALGWVGPPSRSV